jgi:UPF0755 protein
MSDSLLDGPGTVMERRGSHPARRAAVILGGLVALALAVVLLPFGSGQDAADDSSVRGVPVSYEVVPGQTVRSVGDDLAALDVIDSVLRFRRIAEEEGLSRLLRPGPYSLSTGMSEEEAVAVLAAGPQREISPPTTRVRVIEGLLLADTLATIADDLEHLEVADLEAVIAATRAGEPEGLLLPVWWPDVVDAPAGVDLLEGVLWPQTYEVFADASARAVLQRLVDQTVSEMARITDSDLEVGGITRTRHELMTIAALIERETNVDAERPLVSGVIHGRLADGMRLEIDATLSYAKGDLRAVPLDVDRRSESPYNTYRIPGLPPGPISGVGRASLEAAVAPEETAYRFYVLAPACDGSHVFAETFSRHSFNVAAFRAARDAGACE